MAMPAEDAYWQIGSDISRFWSSARKLYVAPSDAGLLAWLASGRTVIGEETELSLSQTLDHIGISDLAPIDLRLPDKNHRAMIRRRAQAMAEDGDQIGALLLLKSAIGE